LLYKHLSEHVGAFKSTPKTMEESTGARQGVKSDGVGEMGMQLPLGALEGIP
jgi:hypothetical protein